MVLRTSSGLKQLAVIIDNAAGTPFEGYFFIKRFTKTPELGLIVVQIEIRNFRPWPYSGANRLGLIAGVNFLKGSENIIEI